MEIENLKIGDVVKLNRGMYEYEVSSIDQDKQMIGIKSGIHFISYVHISSLKKVKDE